MTRTELTESEAASVADVFTTHQRFVENVARQHAMGPDHVADIVQTVGLQLCRGLNGFRGTAEIKTWLYRVTVNAARDHYQAERRQLQRPREAIEAEPEPDQVLDPDAQAHQAERLIQLRAAIHALRPTHQALMWEEMQGTAVKGDKKSTRHRARQQLRKLLATEPGHPN